MKLYIVRHGVTDWNEAKRLQGNSDIPLNEKGRELARITAEGLKDIPFDHIFSSPLGRAVETAEIIRRDRDIPIITDERLIEMGFGIDEGVMPEKRTPGVAVFFTHPEEYVPAEDAESVEAVLARTKDFYENVLVPMSLKEQDAIVMVSGHGAMNKALMSAIEKREVKDYWAGAWQLNCSVFIYEINGHDAKLLEEGKIFYER